MKLKRNCLFFNAKTGDSGRTPDWGHELGQSKGYLMKEKGCSVIINGLVFNQIKNNQNFSYGSGGLQSDTEIISVFSNVNIKVYDFDKKDHDIYTINKPFILIITKETKGVHIGRRTLKMNKAFSYNGNTNQNFYDEINRIILNPWFAYSLSYDNINTGILTLTIIKAPQPDIIENMPGIIYKTAQERKDIWNKLLNDYSEKFDNVDQFSTSHTELNTNSSQANNIIFYGAPGTGKSHTVNRMLPTDKQRVQRVTFHPDYDYSSFVGGYKPTMFEDDIRYEFVPQAFTKTYVNAWNDLDNEHYLVIEEINRGNCAEIFGDIFQLLDRSNNYPIIPSKELNEYLDTFDIDEMPKGEMLLPPNLHIIATMNTSDQSLFPMDSAFKRRWDWEYIPINYESSEENLSSKYFVELDEEEKFSWLSFIEKVNGAIKSNENLGMDKCIGNYFIKPSETTISLDTFINKVIFYLWNDVFKDELEEDSIFKENNVYEDFFPISSNGKKNVKDILTALDVEILR